MAYSTVISEKIRRKKGLTEEQFSVILRFSPRAYPIAIERGELSYRMALEISRRFHIPLKSMESE